MEKRRGEDGDIQKLILLIKSTHPSPVPPTGLRPFGPHPTPAFAAFAAHPSPGERERA